MPRHMNSMPSSVPGGTSRADWTGWPGSPGLPASPSSSPSGAGLPRFRRARRHVLPDSDDGMAEGSSRYRPVLVRGPRCFVRLAWRAVAGCSGRGGARQHPWRGQRHGEATGRASAVRGGYLPDQETISDASAQPVLAPWENAGYQLVLSVDIIPNPPAIKSYSGPPESGNKPH
jgi:hypothetical protein